MTGESVSRESLESALLDFHRAPGRYLVGLRQPAMLFASIRDVVLIAGERSTGESGAARSAAVVNAARFFIRSALLRPATDHYGLLGLADSADAGVIKDRYRSMMRLLHPDFAQGQEALWPADAATRLNQAYEVLSDPDRRRGYDEQLRGGPAAPAHIVTPASHRGSGGLRTVPVATRRDAYVDPRQRLRKLAAGFGFIGAVAGISVWLGSGQADKETLVQRLRVEPSAPDTLKMSDGTPVVIAMAPAAPVQRVSEPQPAPERTTESPAPAAPAAIESAPAQLAVAALNAAPTVPVAAVPPPPPAPVTPLPVLARIDTRPVALLPAVSNAPFVATFHAPAPAPVITAVVQAAPAPPLQPPALVAQVGAPSAAPAPAAPRPAPLPPVPAAAMPVPTMAEVQPQLMRLLQVIENGWGDNLLSGVESPGRRLPEGQALVQHFNDMVAGVKPIRISNVDLRGQPRADRLVVTGQVVLQVRDVTAPARRLGLQAEFVLRNGEPVLTRLMRAQE